jgi:UDP-glucose 4-epimerase
VTGGAGYIATHTIVVLQSAGYDVVAIDNYSNSSHESIENTKKITKTKIIFYEGDVQNGELLDKIFTEHKISSVIHFAGLKAVGESIKIPLKYYENNLICTIELLKAMERHNVKKFVFSSSATVYGRPERLPITEDFPLCAVNPYGQTKLMIETMLRDIYNADNTWKIVILRYFNPVGAHESGLIGENPRGIPNNLMPYVSQVASGKLEYVRVYGDDYETVDGTGVRDYIHVMDLAEGHLAALKNIDKFGVDAVNLGTGKGNSVLEMIAAFEKACGHEIKRKICPRRAGDAAASYTSCDKAYSLLGWKATKGVEEMCRDMWNFEQTKK